MQVVPSDEHYPFSGLSTTDFDFFFYIFCEGFINAVEARSWLPHQLAGEISAACMHIYLHIDWSALPLANELLAIYEESEKRMLKILWKFLKI